MGLRPSGHKHEDYHRRPAEKTSRIRWAEPSVRLCSRRIVTPSKPASKPRVPQAPQQWSIESARRAHARTSIAMGIVDAVMEESQRRGVQVSAVHLRRPDRARSVRGIPSRRCVCGEPRFESGFGFGFGKNGLPGNDSYPTAASLSSPSSCDLGENLGLV